MKTLVVGDMHLKQPFVLPAIDELRARDGEIGRVVFLGDACDDWGATEFNEFEAMEFYARWVVQRRAAGLRVDVLLGNHDFCYIRGKRGPGSIMTAMRGLRSILENGLQAQMACAVGPYVCTHAGLTGVWARQHMADVARRSETAATVGRADSWEISAGGRSGGVVADRGIAPAAVRSADCANAPAEVGASGWGVSGTGFGAMDLGVSASSASDCSVQIAVHLNEMLADSANWAALDSCPPSRGGWSLPGPLWADLRDLLDDPLAGVPQIVGHTPVPCVQDWGALGFAHRGARIWACDTMSLTSGGAPIGDGSMLVVEENGEAYRVPFSGAGGFEKECGEYWRSR